MSNFLRVLMQILIALLILATLIAAIPAFERGMTFKDTCTILSSLAVAGILILANNFYWQPQHEGRRMG